MKSFFFKQKYLVLSLTVITLLFITNYIQPVNATSGTCLVNQQTSSSAGWNPGNVFAENAGCAIPGKTVTIISLNVVANATSQVRVKIYAGNATVGDPSGPISTGPGKLLGESTSQVVTGIGIRNFTLSAAIPSNYTNYVYVSFETTNNSLSLKDSNIGAFFGGGCAGGCYFSGSHVHTYGSGPNPFGLLTQLSQAWWTKIYYSSTPTTLTLNSTNGNVGSTIQSSGQTYGNNTSVLIKYDGVTVTTNPASPITDTKGEFNNTLFTIPQSVAGAHTVNGTDGLNNFSTVSYNVTSSITPLSTSGYVGSLVTGHAYGFLGTHSIHIKFDGTIYQNGTTNSVGSFSTISFNVPSATPGFHTISATDGAHTATAQYYVLGTNLSGITANSTSGSIGKILSIKGNGFNASATIKFYFNNSLTGTTPAVVTSNTTGSFTNVLMTVPALALGTYTIEALDTGGNFGTTSYTINSLGPTLPDAVLDLQFLNVTKTSVLLAWTQPNLHGGTFDNYIINMTTPYGTPNFIISPINPNSPVLISGLALNTTYSFRVGILTSYGFNPYGNILNVQTLGNPVGNFTVGVIQINGTNPVHQPIRFTQTAGLNSSYTNVNVFRPTAYNLNCNIAYSFANTSKNYTNLSKTVYDSQTVYSTFQFKNSQNEIITIKCTDSTTGNSASTVLTQTNSPLLQQVNNFRSGVYGTKGQFGSLDLITLVAVVISMIGFNRVNEAAGVILSVIMVGVLAFFQIIQWPTVMLAAIAVVVMIAVASTRKTSGT